MGIVFSDFGRSKLASGIAAATAAPFTMSLADGTKFKAYGAGEYEYLVLKDASLNREIIKVNARTGNAFTVVQRAIGPTTTRDWAIDDLCEAALTAEGLAALLDNAILTGTTTATQVVVGGDISASSAGVQNVQATGAGFTAGKPSIPVVSDSLAGFAGYGYSNGTAWQVGAVINVRATENWSSIAAGSRIQVRTIQNGTLTLRESFSFDQDGGITLPVLGARIRGDFSNATFSSRLAFQTSTLNAVTTVPIIPNGTSTTSSIAVLNSSVGDNCTRGGVSVNATETALFSTGLGTGSPLPLYVLVGTVQSVYYGLAGQWGIAGANYGTAGQAIVSGGPSAAPAWTTIPTVNNPAFTGTLTCAGDIVAFA